MSGARLDTEVPGKEKATGGMHFIQGLREELARERKSQEKVFKKKVVGGFAFVMKGGFIQEFNWVVSHRKDQRHGVLQPGPVTDYGKSLFEEMFRKW